jgi:hypothetical protein
MTGFSGLTGGVGRLLGLKTLFFNLKLTNLKLKTPSFPEPQIHGEFSEHSTLKH